MTPEERQRRPDDSCDPPSASSFEWAPPPPRPAPDCDPASEEVTDSFVRPEPCADVDIPPSRLPEPLLVRSELTVVTCASISGAGPVGEDIQVPEGRFVTPIYFQVLTDITAERLDALTDLTEAQRAILVDANTSSATIRSITKLTSEQATELSELLADTRDAVNAQARAFGVDLIECGWWNTTQVLECDEGALVSPGPAGQEDLVNNPVTVFAGQHFGPTQADADELALIEAQTLQRCLWGNAEVTVSCTDIGYPDAVPVDTELVGLASRLRVGVVTIPANQIFSQDGQDDADALAEAAATAELICFYLNDAASTSCAAIGKPSAVSRPVTATSGLPGNPVTVQQGYLESSVSQAAVDAEAVALAASLLDCFWLNTTQTAICPELDWEGGKVAAHSSSPAKTVTIPAGTVVSRVSQEDANEQAQLRAQLALSCVYCNPEIAPTCIPSDIESPTIPIPSESVTGDWSIDATPGMAANTICGDGLATLTLALSLASQPLQQAIDTGCTYANDTISAACVDDGVVDVFIFADADVRTQLDPHSRPNPVATTEVERRVIIPAGMIQIEAEDVPDEFEEGEVHRVKHYANFLAQLEALNQLDCYFTNDAQSVGCAPNPPSESGPDVLESGGGASMPAGVIVSYVSKAEANTIASQAIAGSANCNWRSREVTGSNACAEGEISFGPTSLAAGAATDSRNSDYATLVAQQMLDSMQQCVDPSSSPLKGDDGAPGEPGDTGAQTGCSGNCYGYFS